MSIRPAARRSPRPPLLALHRAARRVVRSPAALWSIATALGLLTFVAVRQAATPADVATRFGRPVPAVVLRRAVPAGAVLRTRDLEVRTLPGRAVAPGVVARVERAVGRVALVPLARGEPLLTTRVGPDGVTGAAALLPRGHRGVALTTGTASPSVRPGDVVDVLASYEPGDGGAVVTALVAEAARVVEVAEGTVTVAVAEAAAPDVARATVTAELTLAVRRPDD